MRIGIDIGNVIIGGDGEDTFFSDDYLNTPKVEGVTDALEKISGLGHEIHLVSKCGEKVEEKTMTWLFYHGFLHFGYFKEHRIHFVRKRDLKAPMAIALELDVFIDDRQDIIDSMEGIVDTRILFTSWEQTLRDLEGVI